MTLSEASFESVPRVVYERAVSEVARFSTLLVLDGKFVGSGTLIKCDDTYGILTAHHVVHNPKDPSLRFNFTGTQKLSLLIETRAHHFEIDVRACQCVDIGVPVADQRGPDLSVIVLPKARLGTLKAKKDFYNISARSEEKLDKALCDHGFFIFAGCPACLSAEVLAHGESGQNLFLPIVGACTSLVRRYDEGSFDYLELNVSYQPPSEAIQSFAGMSGGGVWRIPLIKRETDPIDRVTFNEPVLAGVAFYQTGVEAGKCRIRCQGGRSIFVRTLQGLRTPRH
jgi:hypothetical protein